MGPTGGNGDRFLFLLAAVALAGSTDFAAAQTGAGTGPGPSYFDPKNPSMAIVIVVLVTAFFFLGFFSIYIRRCAGGPLGGGPGEYSGGGRPAGMAFAAVASAARSGRVRGVDPAVLEAFPTMAYADVKVHKAGKGALECAVCLSEFDDDEMLRLLPKCSHAFHADCVDAWLASHVTCPVCRANLVPDDGVPVAAAAAVAAPSMIAEQVAPATEQPAQEPTAVAAAEGVTVVTVDAEETEEERIRREEAAELMRIGSVKRALRSKSGRRPVQFPRSHTTGHSLAGAGAAASESSERYKLRLPEHVLRELAAAGKLRRTTSLQLQACDGNGSTRRGGFGGGRAARSVRLGQSGRWPNMSFLARTFSARLPAWGSARRGEADAPAKAAKVGSGGDGKAAEPQCDSGACPLPLGRV